LCSGITRYVLENGIPTLPVVQIAGAGEAVEQLRRRLRRQPAAVGDLMGVEWSCGQRLEEADLGADDDGAGQQQRDQRIDDRGGTSPAFRAAQSTVFSGMAPSLMADYGTGTAT
jgi:hypothetical protein